LAVLRGRKLVVVALAGEKKREGGRKKGGCGCCCYCSIMAYVPEPPRARPFVIRRPEKGNRGREREILLQCAQYITVTRDWIEGARSGDKTIVKEVWCLPTWKGQLGIYGRVLNKKWVPWNACAISKDLIRKER
jgi:hypothetical protein